MNLLKNYRFIIGLLLIIGPMIFSSCFSSQSATGSNSSKKPDWVSQRPTNALYYVGIGYANKISHPGDFQQIAKKNALDDMTGEIKVTVSSNSMLSQYQNNLSFSQQFFSDTRLIAQETIEGFDVVDAWENKTDYWIYYRLNKADFEAFKQRKVNQAMQKSLDLLDRADELDMHAQFVQVFKTKVKAAITLQNYLNEALETDYHGKKVNLINEVINQLESQLATVKLVVDEPTLNVVSGKLISKPIQVKALLSTNRQNETALAFLPLILSEDNQKLSGSIQTETQQDGIAAFGLNKVIGRDAVQILRVQPDIEKLIKVDSMNASMKSLLSNINLPLTNIRVMVQPVKLYLQSEELNLDAKLSYKVIEPALKKKLSDNGCTFVNKKEQADYCILIDANTKDQGIIWGNMQQSLIEMNISLRDTKTDSEIYNESLTTKGFQTTKDRAGLDAYTNLVKEMMNKVYPNLEKQLFNE